MKQNPQKRLLSKLTKWLEIRLGDIEEKIDHIIFRLRYEDPRIYNPYHHKSYDEDKLDEDFKDI